MISSENEIPSVLRAVQAPPTDAEVREAVEAGNECLRVGGFGSVFGQRDLRTLLRAVQAPRLTGDAEKLRHWLGVIAQNISDKRHPHAGLAPKERWSCPCFECVVWRCLQECAAFPGVGE